MSVKGESRSRVPHGGSSRRGSSSHKPSRCDRVLWTIIVGRPSWVSSVSPVDGGSLRETVPEHDANDDESLDITPKSEAGS